MTHRAPETPERSTPVSDTGLPDVPPQGAPSEPLLTVGGIGAIATAIVALLVAFAAPIDNNQQAAILGCIAVAAPFIVALVGRAKVWSPSTVRAMVLAAKATPGKRTMPYTRVAGPDGDVRDLPRPPVDL
jgi:hypothetical protein